MAQLAASLNRDAKIVGLLCFPHAMSHFYYMVLPPMFSVLKLYFGLSYLELGAVLTMFALAASIGQTPIGFLVDRIGGAPVLIGGLVIESIAIASIGLVDSYWQLMTLGTIAGMGHTVFHPADYAIMSTVVSRERMGRAFSVHSFTGFLGFAVAPLFMVGVTALWHWKAAFLLAGVLGLVAALLIWMNSALLQGDAEPVGGRHHHGGDAPDTAGAEALGGVKLLFSVPVLMCFAYFVLHQMGFGGLRNFLEAALSEVYNTPQVISGAVLTGLMSGAAGGILVGGFLADRLGPQIRVACLTLIPSALLIATVGLFDFPGYALVAVITSAGFLMGMLIPSRDLLLRAVTPPGSMGKVMGFASTGSNIGGAIIPVALGWVMDNADPRWIFWIPAIFVAGALFTFIAVKGRYAE